MSVSEISSKSSKTVTCIIIIKLIKLIIIRYNRDPSCDIVIMCQTLEQCYQQSRTTFEERRREIEEILSGIQDVDLTSEVKYVRSIIGINDINDINNIIIHTIWIQFGYNFFHSKPNFHSIPFLNDLSPSVIPVTNNE